MDGRTDPRSSRIETVFRRAARAPTRQSGGVLLVGDPLGGSSVLRVAGAGVLLWQLLDEDRTIAELVELLASELHVSRAEIEPHVTTMVQHLADANRLVGS